MRLPETWVETRVGAVLQRVGDKLDPQIQRGLNDHFIGLENIESNTGLLVKHDTSSAENIEILSVKTPFRRNDILYGRLRPYLNKVHLAQSDGICSTEIWALRATPEILPEFGTYFLRSLPVCERASQLAVGANLPRVPPASFDRIPVLLPTLPEQQRIVEVLGQADRVGFDRRQFGEKVQAILHSALDRVLFAGKAHSLRTLSGLVKTRYGTSVSAEADEASGLPVLRIPNVVTGEVNSSDIKHVALPPTDIERLLLKYGDVLVVRSNGNPDYVGRSAPVTDILTRTPHVYASYLIRLRANIDELLPEYLSSYLNSPYGRAAMRNAIRTTAGQSNLSGESLSRVKIPLPPIEQQRFFAKVWNSLQDLRVLVNNADELGRELVCAMRGEAFTGALTEQWRAQYRAEVHEADLERRAVPRKGADRVSIGITEHAQVERKTVLDPPARAWLASQLSEFQHNVRLAIRDWKGSVVPDDAEAFMDFCSNPGTAWPIEHEAASPDRIKRTLEQLAGLGLIAKIVIPNASGKYVTAFRPLREGEDTRLADASRLEALLRQETEQ